MQEVNQSAVLFSLGIAMVAKMCIKVQNRAIFGIVMNNGYNEMQCVTVSVHLTSSNAAALMQSFPCSAEQKWWYKHLWGNFCAFALTKCASARPKIWFLTPIKSLILFSTDFVLAFPSHFSPSFWDFPFGAFASTNAPPVSAFRLKRNKKKRP